MSNKEKNEIVKVNSNLANEIRHILNRVQVALVATAIDPGSSNAHAGAALYADKSERARAIQSIDAFRNALDYPVK